MNITCINIYKPVVKIIKLRPSDDQWWKLHVDTLDRLELGSCCAQNNLTLLYTPATWLKNCPVFQSPVYWLEWVGIELEIFKSRSGSTYKGCEIFWFGSRALYVPTLGFRCSHPRILIYDVDIQILNIVIGCKSLHKLNHIHIWESTQL